MTEVGDVVTGCVLEWLAEPPQGGCNWLSHRVGEWIQGVVAATEDYDGALLVVTVSGHRCLVRPDVSVVPILATDAASELVRRIVAGEVR